MDIIAFVHTAELIQEVSAGDEMDLRLRLSILVNITRRLDSDDADGDNDKKETLLEQIFDESSVSRILELATLPKDGSDAHNTMLCLFVLRNLGAWSFGANILYQTKVGPSPATTMFDYARRSADSPAKLAVLEAIR